MKKALFFLPVLFLAIGCDKDDNDDDSTTGKTKTQILTESTWKFQGAGLDVDKNGVWETNLASFIPDCAKDNTLKFEANGTGTSDEGVNKCSPGASQTTSFSWAFASNETEILITGNAVLGYGGQYKVVSLTDTKMSLSKDTTISMLPGNHTIIADFVH
jgi:hypothetical protein